MPHAFCSGEAVPQSGIYRVCHEAHALPAEVTLLRGDEFPPCSRCTQEVLFYMVRNLKGVRQSRFRVRLHTLPVLGGAAGNENAA